MRFFHLSDLHIGKQLHHYNLKEEQVHILNQVVALAEEMRPDAIMIAGDIYDKSVPSAEAVTIFDDFLTKLSQIEPAIPVLIISGNHDNAKRLQYASGILKSHHIYLAGSAPQTEEEYLSKLTFQDEYGDVDVYMLPFFKPSYVRGVFQKQEVRNLEDAEEGSGLDNACSVSGTDDEGNEDKWSDDYTHTLKRLLERENIDFANRRNILISHQFYGGKVLPETCDSESICVGGLDNIDSTAVEDFDYVALGHLHGKQSVGKPYIRYCGTLLKYSVSESEHKKTLSYVTLKEKGSEPEITELPLSPLRDVRRKRGTLKELLDEAKNEERDDYVSITLTDEVEPYHPKEQLSEVYDHILEIRIDNTRTRRKLSEFEDEKIEMKSPMEAFEDFYSQMQGRKMDEEETKIMKKIFHQIEEE